jgi:hypothetical protein
VNVWTSECHSFNSVDENERRKGRKPLEQQQQQHMKCLTTRLTRYLRNKTLLQDFYFLPGDFALERVYIIELCASLGLYQFLAQSPYLFLVIYWEPG